MNKTHLPIIGTSQFIAITVYYIETMSIDDNLESPVSLIQNQRACDTIKDNGLFMPQLHEVSLPVLLSRNLFP